MRHWSPLVRKHQCDKVDSGLPREKEGLYKSLNLAIASAIQEQYDITTRGAEPPIKVFLPVDARILNSKLFVNWEPKNNGSTYFITVKGIFDDVLFEDETKMITYLLDLDNEKLKDESTFVIVVTLKENEDIHSHEYVVNRISENESAKPDWVHPIKIFAGSH